MTKFDRLLKLALDCGHTPNLAETRLSFLSRVIRDATPKPFPTADGGKRVRAALAKWWGLCNPPGHPSADAGSVVKEALFELTRDDFRAMHHALGYPKNVMNPSHRNSYCADVGTPKCLRLELVAARTGFLREVNRMNGGRTVVFEVTNHGRAALADWLEMRWRW